MSDNKREQERTELHRTIWAIANDLRGSVDGWDFKQYVLGMLFYRYISENITKYLNEGELEAGNSDFDYAKLSDEEAEIAREDMVKTKGFFILPSQLFKNVVANAKNDENLNETLENIFKSIEASAQGSGSEANFKGLFDDLDVNSNKLGSTVSKRNERLVKLLNGIAGMKLGDYQDNSIDAFGDAYEYLMGMYASDAGKSGGEYFTPQEVSELLAKITLVGKTEVNKVYDPAVGSGSLLLKFAEILGKDNVRNGFFGQEINITTYNLCRINMFLHDIGYEKFNIENGDTLIDPRHWDDEPFDAIVSNPPYSIKWEGSDNGTLINDPRFSPAGVLAPKSKADLAFIMHSLSWLATNGTAAIVCFPGVMYRGGAEQKIRKYLIDNNYVDCIIQLPGNLFFGTPIATCILVLKKSKSKNSTLFIDASKEYIKVTNNNKLSATNIENIINAYTNREDKKHFTRLVENSEIAKQDYNLSVNAYIEQENNKEVINIVSLNNKIKEIVNKEQKLRDEIEDISNQLLTFNEQVEWKNLGDIAEFRRGSFPQPYGDKRWYDGENAMPFVQVADIAESEMRLNEKTKRQISLLAQPKSVFVPKGTVIVSLQGSIGKVAITQYDCYVDRTLAIFENFSCEIDKKYFAYQLERKFAIEKEFARGSTLKTITKEEFTKFQIPLPPLKEQQRIVDILDRFSKLYNDITMELYAELDARRKQYNYHRDGLLTFKEMNE